MINRAESLAVAVLLGMATLPAAAQTPPAKSSGDQAAIWSIQGENASISSASVTDRYYTNGLRIGWTSPEGYPPGWLENVGRLLWGKGNQRITVDLSQQIYTPYATGVKVPPAGDRPYAATLLLNTGLQQDGDGWRSVLGMSLGVMGPAAGGEWVQNGFHDLIGQKGNKGWSSQLKDEPVLQFTSARTWQLPTGSLLGLETDALPDLTAELGTLRIYVQPGVRFRIGQGLNGDFGPARLRPGQSGGDAFAAADALGWYLFAGGDGRAVLRDGTLEGNIYQSSPSVKKTPFVGELEVGGGITYRSVRLTYTQVFQTAEFRHQKGGLHQFGSVNLAARF